MNWDDARILLAVARSGTFSGAARALGVDETTISRRLGRAERSLAVSLFQARDGRRVPTPTGAKLLAQAERLEAEALRLEMLAAADPDAPVGRVTLAATEMIARHILAASVGGFLAGHPRISLRLRTGHENVSFARWEADLAVRLSRPEQGDLVIRKLADVDFAVYRAARRPEPDQGGPPARWIGYDEDLARLPEARYVADRLEGHELALHSNDSDTLAEAAAAGAGAAVLPVFLGEPRSDLVRDKTADPAVRREAWLLVRPDLREAPAVRATADWVGDVFRRMRDRFAVA
ncbi:MAG: LysR family transcriptional regulator [Methyloligellaceae bacterium]